MMGQSPTKASKSCATSRISGACRSMASSMPVRPVMNSGTCRFGLIREVHSALDAIPLEFDRGDLNHGIRPVSRPVVSISRATDDSIEQVYHITRHGCLNGRGGPRIRILIARCGGQRQGSRGRYNLVNRRKRPWNESASRQASSSSHISRRNGSTDGRRCRRYPFASPKKLASRVIAEQAKTHVPSQAQPSRRLACPVQPPNKRAMLHSTSIR